MGVHRPWPGLNEMRGVCEEFQRHNEEQLHRLNSHVFVAQKDRDERPSRCTLFVSAVP